MRYLIMLLQMEIDTTETLIEAQIKELENSKDEWVEGFHVGLKLAYEQKLKDLKNIRRVVESIDTQRASAEPVAR